MNNEPMSLRDFISAMGEHIAELRKRAIISFISLIISVIICMFFAEPLMEFLCRPIDGMKNLVAIEVTENVVSVFNVSVLFGFILSLPITGYQFLAFIIPALKQSEKKYLFAFLPTLVLFFLFGVLFSYFVMLPASIPFLTSFMGIRTEIHPSNYISFTTTILFWVGITFELPIIMFILARLGIVTSRKLLKGWRYAIIFCAVFAMIITPTVDPYNMLLFMVPMMALYFVSIIFAKAAYHNS